jgi:hypothetical protein
MKPSPRLATKSDFSGLQQALRGHPELHPLADEFFAALAENRRREAMLKGLSELTMRINAGLTLEQVLQQLFTEFQAFIPYERIGLSLLEEPAGLVRAVWARTDTMDTTALRLPAGYSSPLRGSSLQTILETGHPRILNDLPAYLAAHPHSHSTALIVEEGFHSSLTCPLRAENKPVGFLFFTSRKPDTYADAHVETFVMIANAISVIIEKARAYQRLVELNELKNKFLGIAAHDLRSPISLVRSYLDAMQSGLLGENPEERTEIFGRVTQTCDRMLALINDLLDISAIESGNLNLQLEKVDSGRFFSEIINNHRLLTQAKHISIVTDFPAEMPTITADAKRLTQVMDNLLSNAAKFSTSGTTITCKAHLHGNRLHIQVADQGPGIPAAELKKLFREFGKTSVRPTGGEKSTGLGLAIVKRIIEGHEGKVWVTSEVGAGSVFSFDVPFQPSALRS